MKIFKMSENRWWIAALIAVIVWIAIAEIFHVANAQSITSVSCVDVPVDVGNAAWGNNTINFKGTFFEAENDISVEEIRLPMFRQSGGLDNNQSRWTLYQVNGVPTSLGANQPTFSGTASAIPLWTSGSIAKADLPTYSSFTDAQRGDPDNWHSEAVSPAVELEAGNFYAVGAWAFVNGTTSFAQQVAYGQNSTGDCGIDNVYITASGQVYTSADDILTANINAGSAGCFFSAFGSPCNTVVGTNASAPFAIYGLEVFPNDTTGTIDSWIPNFLTSIGMNTPIGKILVGVIFAGILFFVMSAWKIPWIISLGVAGMSGTFLTAATVLDPAILLGMVAIIGLGAIGLIFSLFLGGGNRD